MKECTKCGVSKPYSEYHADKRNNDGKQSSCKTCTNARKSESRRVNRIKLLKDLGGECDKCGNSDVRVLQIDHIQAGEGNAHRKSFSCRRAYWRFIRENRKLFQLLCANCHCIKSYDEGDYNA